MTRASRRLLRITLTFAALCACADEDTPPLVSTGTDAALADAGSAFDAAEAATPVLPPIDAGRPNAAKTCTPGVYVGSFMCTYKPNPMSLFAPPFDMPVSGDVRLEVVTEGAGEFTATGAGALSGTANGLYDFKTQVMGTIDCATGKFSGAVTGGSVAFFGIPIAEFSGTLGSGYDGDDPAFVEGQWVLTVPDNGTCEGPWNAALDHDAGLADAGPDAG